MNRLTNSTKAANLFGAGKHGFTDGIPSVTPATILDSVSMNPIQEELARAVEDAGVSLSSSDLGQLSQILIGRDELSALCDLRVWDSGGGSQLNCAAANADGSIIVIVGTNGKIYTTSLGSTTLTEQTSAGGGAFAGTWNVVRWNGTAFIAAGDSGTIQTSPDGVTWTSRASGTASTLLDLAVSASGDGSVIATTSSGGLTLFSSNSGATWTLRTVINGGTFNANAITSAAVSGSTVWVIGGPNADRAHTLYYSTNNGSTWTAIDLTSLILSTDRVISVGVRSLASAMRFVAYVQATDDSAKGIFSLNGVAWFTLFSTSDAVIRRMGVGRASLAMIRNTADSSTLVTRDLLNFSTLTIPKLGGGQIQLLQGTGWSVWCLCGAGGGDNGRGAFSRVMFA
jgi:hypothetical protein